MTAKASGTLLAQDTWEDLCVEKLVGITPAALHHKAGAWNAVAILPPVLWTLCGGINPAHVDPLS